ncbi:MAG: histidine--tRNA ligase family protein, partial [Candidatus Heimdallarchaeota archaeon]|nr:histidine--tRNA ligase family protein [Candidatus Heimdallarchaeota archaeon]
MDSELKEILKGIKGFRDYYPEDYAEINHILGTMKKVSEEFGYEEYEGPSLEYAKLIEIKSGQELLDETFTVISKDERKLVLRPEQTPTLARMIANQHQRYIKPMRWYSLPRIFKNETPQKGRVREFFQYNADILGVDHPAADAEIIAITTRIIKDTGLNSGEFICVINSRELMQSYIEYLEIPNYIQVVKIIDSRGKFLQNLLQKELKLKLSDEKKAKEKALELRTIWEQDPELEKDYSDLRSNPILAEYLDRLSEIEEKSVKETLRKIDLNEDQITKFYDFATQSGSPDFVINKLKTMEIGVRTESALQNLEDLCKYLKLFNIFDDCEYDTSVARGLDYYTGIVYEFFDRTGSVVRSIAGGGRYDQLVSA